jgi:hypothetical protein
MIQIPQAGTKWSVIDPAGAVVAQVAEYMGTSAEYVKGTKVDLLVFGLPDGSQLVIDAAAAYSLAGPKRPKP